MKKILTFLALCCLMVTGAWADGFQASTVETPVVYVLTNANNMTIASNLTYHGSGGSSAAPKGKFAFISTGETDKYKIYETISQKYVALSSTASIDCKSGTQLVSSDDAAETFTITASTTPGQFLISPTSIGATYLNFNGGVSGNSDGQTVGFWTDGNSDAGSRWTFAEPLTFKSDAYYVFRCNGNNNYVTYNANANDDNGVNHLANAGNSTYSSQALFRIVTNGDQFNIIPAAAPSNYVFAINKDDANSNVGIGALSGEETAATEKYLWNITQVSDGLFTIIPKGGSLSWNCRGSVNGVNVIGQWNAGTDDSRWMITEVAVTTYTLNFENVPTGQTPVVYYNGDEYDSTETITGVGITSSVLKATAVPGYKYTITIGTDNVITVTYAPNVITDNITYGALGTTATESWDLVTEAADGLLGITGTSVTLENLRVLERTVNLEQAGYLAATFNYTSGYPHRIDIAGVEVVDGSGNIVNADYHFGYSGGNYSNKTYNVEVPSAGLYTFRYYSIYTSGSWDTAGTITHQFTPKETKTYTVHITGTADGKLVYNETEYADTQTFEAEALTVAQLSATTVTGYIHGGISIDETDIYVNYLAVPVAGDYIRLQNCKDNKYLTANGAKMNDIENGDNASLKSLWYVKDNGSGALQLMSVATGGFIGNITQSATVSLNTGNTTTFVFEAYNDHIVFKPTGGGDYQYGHVNGGDLVGWTKTGDATQWVLTKVETPAMTDYTITVTGLPEGDTGGLLYYGQMHTSTLNAPAGLDASLLTGASVSGYKAPTVSMEGTAITVTYVSLPFVVGETYTIKGVFADKDAEWYICDSGTTAVAAAELPADKSGNWIYTGDGKFQNVKNNTRYLATGSGLTTNTTGVAFTVQDGIAEGAKTLFNGSTSYAVGKAGDISGGQYGKGEKHNTGDWTTDFFIEILSVTVPNTLTPADGAEVNSLNTVSVEFTGDNVSEGIIPFPGGQLEGTTQILPTLKNGETTVTATSVAVRTGVYNIFDITFPTGQITSGEWKLDIPQGTFYVAVPDAPGEYDPVARIKANYTVSLIPIAGKVYTIKAHFTNTTYNDLYLSSATDAEQLLVPMETMATASQSYWVAEDSGNTDRPWKFKSGYGYAKYLDWQNGGLSANGDNFGVLTCGTVAGTYHLNVSNDNRNIGTWGDNNNTKKGFGAVGSGGCWGGKGTHNNGGNPAWTTDYIIEEVKNVDVYTVSGSGSVGVTGISGYTYASAVAAGGVLIVPAGTTLTDANFTNDANTLVVVDATAKTITLTEIIVTKPTSLDQIEQGVPYTITTYNRGAMIYTENGLSSTTNVGVDVDPTDANQQFLFVEHHGQYYFYSVGGEKFINVTGKNENNNRAVGVDAPVNTSLIFDASTGSRKADFPIVLNIDGHHVGISNGFVPAVITHYNGTADDGNMLRLTPVLGTTVDLDPIIAKFPKICPIDAATYYVTIENHETGRQPFLFNDVQYADEITLQGASHDTSKNGYIWKVTSDGAGNITVLNAENGKGIKPKSSNYSGNITSLQYEVYPEDANYFFLKFRTGSHDRLNATASGFSNEAGKKAVTTWDGNHPDNAWKFNAVDTEDLEEYNVVVTQPDGCRGYVLYDGKKAGNGGFLLAPADLEQSVLTAGELRGFICDGVTLTDHTITLTYTTAEPVQVNYTLYLKEGDTETLLETAAEAVTEYVGQAPQHPFTVPDYVDVTYDQGVDENGLIDGTATAIKVVTAYNDLMPFTPGELTTVDIDIRNHYYFHVEERTITIDGESKKLWLPCISPKAPTFDDDAAYIWRMEGDWYHGFRFHNDQLAKEGEGDGTACHITYKHKEVMSETMEQMEGMKGETSLTEKTYTLESTTDLSIASRATLTGDADDRNSYLELVHATGNIQHYNGEPAEWQFRLMDHKNLYLNFRDYSAVGDNPDSLLCLYGAGYGDNASSFTFHKNEVCTEDDRQAVLAMIDAIEKGAVGALIDKTAQEYQDLLTLKGRIEDTTIGCTRALFDIYTEKLVNANKERKVATDGEAYRLAVRTKQGRNFYLKDDGTYTTDSLDAAIYVLGSSADGTKKILAGNNNADLYYFRNGGLTQASYAEGDCDFNYELMAGKETVADVLDATGAAKYATVCLTDGNGKVATMTSPDKATATGTCTWEEPQDVVYMNDELSSAIVMEPVPYPYNKPKFAVGSPDDHEGGYASIWLPYPMIFPDGVEVYRATDAESDGLLVLKKVNTDRVVAAGGYIIRDPNKASTMTVLPAPANPDDVEYSETNAFVGSTENPLVVKEEGSWSAFLTAQGNPTGTPYVLAKKNEGIGYYKYNAGTDDLLPKGKAIWFSNYKADSSSDCLRFTFGDIVEAIKALNGEATDAEIYDLQGHRLNKAVKGQVNVINGKKVMFK